MKETKKTYWKGLEQLSNDPEFVKYADKEFAEYLPVNGDSEQTGSTRRDFLKLMGFSVAAVSVAACEAPVRKAIPYLNKPVDVDPGVPNFYASTFMKGGNYCSILVKTREGRPIKIEGNDQSPITKGGTSAQVEASVLELYDTARLKGPMKGGSETDWNTIDSEITAALSSAESVKMVTNTIISPSTKAVIAQFKAKFANTEVITYDPQSASGLIQANGESFGKTIIPSYDFSKADVIVSFDADFLGTWISPVEFTKQYSQTRKLGENKKKMSRHFQFEANLSTTGANADYRTPVKPSQLGSSVVALYNAIAKKAGAATVAGGSEFNNIDKAAADLWSAKGKSLVVSGSNDKAVQVMVNAINDLLGNYGKTIDLNTPVNYRQGDDEAMERLVDRLVAKSVPAVIFLDCNPVFNHARGAEIAAGIPGCDVSISTADRFDETSSLVKYVATGNHYLESWSDAEPKPGHLSLGQPTISKIFNTRQTEESLLTWSGNKTDYYTFISNRWKENYFGSQTKYADFQTFFDSCLHDGLFNYQPKTVVEVVEELVDAATENTENVPPAPAKGFAGNLNEAAKAISDGSKSSGMELALYFNVGIGDGSQANNPWLQEMPDPITKATWDNYVTISQSDAMALEITSNEGKTNMVELKVGDSTFEMPVLIQPGQASGSIGLALGYGRTVSGKVANHVGLNAYPFRPTVNGSVGNAILSGVSLTKLDKKYQVAQTQTHETYMNRDFVIQESTLGEYQNDPSAGRYKPAISTWKSESGTQAPATISLWKGHEYPDHHWGLAIDMNSCTGCSACTIACQVENNIPVVGRDEVIRRREMHWIRIDRYYSSDADTEDLDGLEIAAQNPEVTFQPMMCQHCNNAPCETVCPVAATTHSTEGLNQMTYNRCIGTRYCANNCPYKVRRFNWFKYHDNKQFADANTPMNSDLGKMVLNPDVTVRSRGVMEKCSFCVQRIQYGKLEAKKEGRVMNDADVNTACASSCPADALVFGDLNNPNSRISKMLKIKTSTNKIDKEIGEERAYAVLEEVGVKPNVLYLTKIRNKDKEA